MEVRISNQNWEPVFFEAWILQIILRELFQVPSMIETGTPDAKLNLYDPHSPFDNGDVFDVGQIILGAKLGDCRLASHNPESYEPCAHIDPEVWGPDSAALHDLVNNETLEAPPILGALGQEFWFVTKFTAAQDPTIVS
jgi:hypothetical protein